MQDCSREIRRMLSQRHPTDVVIAKRDAERLLRRNGLTLTQAQQEAMTLRDLRFAFKKEHTYENSTEFRYTCYCIYSNTRGRCFVLRLNGTVKIVTMYPLGRKTIRRYLRRIAANKI
jgi:hypothetical protein